MRTPGRTSGSQQRTAALRAVVTEWRWQLARQRRPLLGWAIALTTVAGIYIPFFPAMGGAELQAMVDTLPEGLIAALGYDRIGSPAGYLTSTVFGLLAPALLLVFAVSTGARTVAGEEEAGLLELAASGPVDRHHLLAARIIALHTQVALLATVMLIVTLVLSQAFDLDVRPLGIVVASVALNLFIIAFGTVALAAGAVTGRRGVGIAVGAGLAVAAYVANTIAAFLARGELLERLSPFAWYLAGDPVATARFTWGHVALGAVAFLAWGAAHVGFARRDLGV
jgi:ABC-2 type transport system permease protein